MLAAENYAGRAPPQGIYEWSPTLEKVGRIETCWKLRVEHCREGGVVSGKLIRMHKDRDIGIQGSLDEVQAAQHLSRVWKTLRGAQKDSENKNRDT